MLSPTEDRAERRLQRPRLRRIPRNSQSPDAIVQRRYRERRARGAVVIQRLVLSPTAIGGLIRLGWLAEADRGDRERVGDALVRFCKHALILQREAE